MSCGAESRTIAAWTPRQPHALGPTRGTAPGARWTPLDYARWALAEEEGDPEVWWGEPLLAGNRAVVEWWAVTVENGELVSLAGTSWLRFSPDGRVAEQHDYWGSIPGRALPWEGWGS